MSDAADRRIAELEAEVRRLMRQNGVEREISASMDAAAHRLDLRIVELEKKLVERDVYEAQQILPPEQAALIKHLKTVERCIEEGPVSYSYAESSECQFCTEWQTGAHTRECAWLALQFDRKPEATMTMVHEHALNEHETWKRRQPRGQRLGLTATMLNTMRENNIGPLPEVAPLSAEDALRASMAVRESQEALARRGSEIHRDMADATVYGLGTVNIQASNHVPPGTAYIMPLSFSVLPPEARPVASNLGIGGEEPTEVAPPDDEDVP